MDTDGTGWLSLAAATVAVSENPKKFVTVTATANCRLRGMVAEARTMRCVPMPSLPLFAMLRAAETLRTSPPFSECTVKLYRRLRPPDPLLELASNTKPSHTPTDADDNFNLATGTVGVSGSDIRNVWLVVKRLAEASAAWSTRS